MKNITITVSVAVLLTVVVGIAYSSSGEYTNRNAKIVARTSTVYSTISGKISGPSLVSGSRVSRGNTLATVLDLRVSRESLSRLENEYTSLEANIKLLSGNLKKAKENEVFYSNKHEEWITWLTKDLQFREQQLAYELSSEEIRFKHATTVANRARKLRQDSVISKSELLDARHAMNIASSVVNTRKMEHTRAAAQLQDLKAGLPVFDINGDVSYWYRLTDDNNRLVDEISAQIVQKQSRLSFVTKRMAEELALYEVQRKEDHKAKFDGLVNTVYVRSGDLVTPNTPILEVLDCNQLTVIAPVTAARQSYFLPGQKVLIEAHSGSEIYAGRVKLISTGTLLGRDKTLPADHSLLRGHSLIITFDDQLNDPESPGSPACDVETNATVTIDIDSRVVRFKEFVEKYTLKGIRSIKAIFP